MDVEPLDAGVSGAKMAIDENNAGGQFTGEVYNLDVSTVTSPDKAVEALQKLYDSGHHFIIVDGSAETLLKLSDFAKGKDILLFNVRAEDVSLMLGEISARLASVAWLHRFLSQKPSGDLLDLNGHLYELCETLVSALSHPERVMLERSGAGACRVTSAEVIPVCLIVTEVVTNMVFTPPWTPDKMSEDAKFALGY